MPPIIVHHPISCIAGVGAVGAAIVAETYRSRALNHLSDRGSQKWWVRRLRGGLLFAERKDLSNAGWTFRAKYYRVQWVFWAAVLLAIFAW